MKTHHSSPGTVPSARVAQLLAVGAIGLLLGLAGCSGGANDDAKPDETSSATDGKDKVSGDTGDLDDPQGAISSLGEFKCKADDGGTWSASGTLTNTGRSKLRYLVSASVIESKTHTVLGQAAQTYTVKPGSTRDVNLDEIYNKIRKGIECVPRVVSGS